MFASLSSARRWAEQRRAMGRRHRLTKDERQRRKAARRIKREPSHGLMFDPKRSLFGAVDIVWIFFLIVLLVGIILYLF